MDKEYINTLAQNKGINVALVTEEMYKPKEIQGDKDYTISDCILVRTTNIFPKDKIIQTPANGHAIEERTSDFFREILYSKLNSKYPDRGTNSVSQEQFSKELDEFNIYSEFYRSTVHFTINGLVGNHLLGNFSNRPYIILEPLKYHVVDQSLTGMRVEDTYFNDDLSLSNESILLIPHNMFEATINNEEYLETLKKFNVVVFDGNDELAVRVVLDSLGYDSFIINNHGYVDNVQANKMDKCVTDFAKHNNISMDKHWDSQIRLEDNEKRFKLMEESEINHLYYILDNCTIDNDLKERIKYYCNNNYTFYLEEELSNLIDVIGLDTLKQLTNEYNKQFIEENSLKRGINK